MKLNSIFPGVAFMVFAAVLPADVVPLNQLSANTRLEVLEDIKSHLAANVYDKEVAGEYILALERFAESGILNKPMGADEFAITVHRALHRSKLDFHLGIYPPDLSGAGESDKDGESHDDHGEPSDDGGAFVSIAVEEGGVRLIKLNSFSASDRAIERMYDVFNEVEQAPGLIIDLRGNMGGDAKLARLVLGCLLNKATRLYTINIPHGEHQRLSHYTSEPDSRCAQVSDKPLAVLVDHSTASTAELFALVLQNRNRAIIVGEQTLGGGHAAEFFGLAHGFRMMIPIGTVTDDMTGKGWESVGVTPDVICKPVEARMRAIDAINSQT